MTPKQPESFLRRRVRHITVFAVMLLMSCAMVWLQHNQLGDTGFSTGYALLAAIVFLASYSLKKRLSFLRFLGTSSSWLHAHIYVALGTFAFFLIHIGFRIPQGFLEQLLAVMFVAVSMSGFVGLYMTRTYPRKLTNTKREYIYERIPVERMLVIQEAEAIVLQMSQQSTTLGDFYRDRLLPFFAQSRSFWYLTFPNGRLRRNLMQELRNLDRYLVAEQRPAAQSLGRLIQSKDDIDFHFALQSQLKLWLFFHIACTYSLLLLGLVHAVLVHAFDGGTV